MSLKIVVLAKQVPDTRCVGERCHECRRYQLTVAALPAIFNPEDLNAWNNAQTKDTHPVLP